MRIVLRCLCLSQPSSPISCLPDRFPRKYVSSCWPVSFLEFGSGEQSHLSEIGLFFAFYIVNSSAGGGASRDIKKKSRSLKIEAAGVVWSRNISLTTPPRPSATPPPAEEG